MLQTEAAASWQPRRQQQVDEWQPGKSTARWTRQTGSEKMCGRMAGRDHMHRQTPQMAYPASPWRGLPLAAFFASPLCKPFTAICRPAGRCKQGESHPQSNLPSLPQAFLLLAPAGSRDSFEAKKRSVKDSTQSRCVTVSSFSNPMHPCSLDLHVSKQLHGPCITFEGC